MDCGNELRGDCVNIGEQARMKELEYENKILRRSLVAVTIMGLLVCGFTMGVVIL